MFSPTDAQALRKQLTPIDLSGPQTEQTAALTAYRRHYGIDADSLGVTTAIESARFQW